MDLPVLNTQKAEGFNFNSEQLHVHSIFRTIQGEGPFTGHRAVFVRLAGCNLQCPNCDTDYTSRKSLMTPVQILGVISDTIHPVLLPRDYPYSHKNKTLIVLTGGEPFRQNLVRLLQTLVGDHSMPAQAGLFHVQIETNGVTLPPLQEALFQDANELLKYYQLLNPFVTVVCSPKTTNVHHALRPVIKHLKYVVAHNRTDAIDGLPNCVLGKDCFVARPWPEFTGRIYISPEDSKDEKQNKLNVEEAVRVCDRFGYVLSLQTHKITGLP